MTSGNNVLQREKFYHSNQSGYVEIPSSDVKNWIPVRIKIRGGSIRSVRTNITTPNKSNDTRTRLKGQTLKTPNEPILENIEKGFIAAANGTVKHGRGGGAYSPVDQSPVPNGCRISAPSGTGLYSSM